MSYKLFYSSKETTILNDLPNFSNGTAISKGKAGGKAGVAKNTRSSTRRRILAPKREDDDNDDEDFVLSDLD